MKTKLLFIVAFTLIHSTAFASPGGEKGNGGDWYGFHYSNIARQVADRIQATARFERPKVDPVAFRESVRTTSVVSLPTIVKEDRERDAYTYVDRSPKLTEVSRKRWREENDSDKLRMQIHEYLVALKLEESDQYYLSMEQAEQLERLIAQKKLLPIDFAKFSPESRMKELENTILTALLERKQSITCKSSEFKPSQYSSSTPVLVLAVTSSSEGISAWNSRNAADYFKLFINAQLKNYITLYEDLSPQARKNYLKSILFSTEVDSETYLPKVTLDYLKAPTANPKFLKDSHGLKLETVDGLNWVGSFTRWEYGIDSDEKRLKAQCKLNLN